MPKKIKEREIVTSVSKTSNKKEVKENLTKLLINTIVKRGIGLLDIVLLIWILCLITIVIYNFFYR